MASLSITLDELAPSFEALCLIFDQLYATEPFMADRFPSLEELSEGSTEVKGNGTLGIDGDDDFLSRERALLGDDASQFASTNDHPATATVEDGDDDLLGDGGYNDAQAGGDDIGQFESSFPAVDNRNEAIGPGGTITNSVSPFQPSQQSYSNYTAPEEDPEPIRQWRERRDQQLSERSKISAAKKEETVKAAQKSIDDFYENYNAKKDISISRTRKEAEEFLASREDTSAGGTSWERIGKLVDLSGKGSKGGASGTGKERFRELLVELRKDEKAPGASGY